MCREGVVLHGFGPNRFLVRNCGPKFCGAILSAGASGPRSRPIPPPQREISSVTCDSVKSRIRVSRRKQRLEILVAFVMCVSSGDRHPNHAKSMSQIFAKQCFLTTTFMYSPFKSECCFLPRLFLPYFSRDHKPGFSARMHFLKTPISINGKRARFKEMFDLFHAKECSL